MNLSNYVPAIHFAGINKETSIKLGELAHSILHNSALPKLPADILVRAKEAFIVDSGRY